MLVVRRFTLVAVVLALVAAACGSGESEGTTTTTTTTIEAGPVAATTTSTTQQEAPSGDSGSTYCERLRAIQDEGDESPLSFSFFNMTPAEIEAQFKQNLEIFEEWVEIVPSEIEDAAIVVLEAYKKFVARGNELGWNLEAMGNDPEFNASFDDAALTAAADRLDAYSRDVCGVEFSTDTDPGSGDGQTSDDPIAIVLNAFQLPASLFSEDDIECIRAEVGAEFEASITPDWVPSSEDIEVLLGAIDACGISLG